MKQQFDTGWLLLAGSFLYQEYHKANHIGSTKSDLDLLWLSDKEFTHDKDIANFISLISSSFRINSFNHVSVRTVNNDVLANVPGWIANTWLAAAKCHNPIPLPDYCSLLEAPDFIELNDRDIVSAIEIGWIYLIFAIVKCNSLSEYGYALSKLFLIFCKVYAQREKIYELTYIKATEFITQLQPQLYKASTMALNTKIGIIDELSKSDIALLIESLQLLISLILEPMRYCVDSLEILQAHAINLIIGDKYNESIREIVTILRHRSQNLPYFEKGRERQYNEAAFLLERKFLQ